MLTDTVCFALVWCHDIACILFYMYSLNTSPCRYDVESIMLFNVIYLFTIHAVLIWCDKCNTNWCRTICPKHYMRGGFLGPCQYKMHLSRALGSHYTDETVLSLYWESLYLYIETPPWIRINHLVHLVGIAKKSNNTTFQLRWLKTFFNLIINVICLSNT